MLEKIFQLEKNNTTVKTELVAGFTTFITMAYIIFVNPQMMSSTGMDQGASFVGTCLAAAIACILMGIYANWPIGLLLQLFSEVFNLLLKVFVLFCLLDISHVGHVNVCLQICHLHL